MGALMVRRRTGLSREARILAATRGRYEGLHLPGPASAVTRWSARLDVVLVPGELRVSGNGGLWRYQVSDIVLVSAGAGGTDTVRFDFLEGEPLVVTLRDREPLLAALRLQIEEYERALRNDGHLTVWLVRDHLTGADLEASVQALTPAVNLLHSRRLRTLDRVPSGGWAADGHESAHRERVEVLRAARRNLVTLSRLPA